MSENKGKTSSDVVFDQGADRKPSPPLWTGNRCVGYNKPELLQKKTQDIKLPTECIDNNTQLDTM